MLALPVAASTAKEDHPVVFEGCDGRCRSCCCCLPMSLCGVALSTPFYRFTRTRPRCVCRCALVSMLKLVLTGMGWVGGLLVGSATL